MPLSHDTNWRKLCSSFRFQCWPIGKLRKICKAVSRCVRCFRTSPSFVERVMASLLNERLEAVPTSTVSSISRYVSVFICFTSKAMHLELFKDLPTAKFFSALKRFIATHGKPSQIWSDNAANLFGAKNGLIDLKRLLLKQLSSFVSQMT